MKFKSETHPELRVVLADGSSVKFRGGEYETTDKAQIDALKALPDGMGVKAASGGRAKADKGDE